MQNLSTPPPLNGGFFFLICTVLVFGLGMAEGLPYLTHSVMCVLLTQLVLVKMLDDQHGLASYGFFLIVTIYTPIVLILQDKFRNGICC